VFQHGWDADASKWEKDRLTTLVRWVRILRDVGSVAAEKTGSTLYPINDGQTGIIPCKSSDIVLAGTGSNPFGWKPDKTRIEPDGGITVRSEGGVDSFERLDELMTTKLWSGGLTQDGERSYPMPVTAADHRIELAQRERIACAKISEDATDLLRSFISTAFGLECVLFSNDLAAQPKLRWMARDESGALVEPRSLSPIQRRWGLIAANGGFSRMVRSWSEHDEAQAIASDWWDQGDPRTKRSFLVRWPVASLTLVDEPEAGLHPSAALRVGAVLRMQALHESGMVVVTTHSPQILGTNLTGAREVYRTMSGSVQVRTIPSLSEVRADALGMSKADLLLLYRVVLIVEGQHDEVVLRSLLGDDLNRLGVLVLPLRGAKGAKSLADAAILARTLSAPIVVLFDNDRSGQLAHFWDELQSLLPHETNQIDELIKTLPPEAEFPEVVYIASLARELHELRQVGRFYVRGLRRADIVEYLPVDAFVGGAGSWDQLRADHALLAEGSVKEKQRSQYQRDFKKWLTAQHGADFSDALLRAACAELSDVPPEFVALATILGEVASASSDSRNEYPG
jgi:hypothetical protein